MGDLGDWLQLTLVWLHRAAVHSSVSLPASVAPCQVNPGHTYFVFFDVHGFVSGPQVRKDEDPFVL